MKKYILGAVLLFSANLLMAGACSEAKVDVTFYGAKDKSYVVTKNIFKKIKITGDKLLGAKAEIDLTTLDTSADLNNGTGGKWPLSMIGIRNRNTVNNLFKKFSSGNTVAVAEVTKVNKDSLDVSITMNGVTKTVSMQTKNGVASGKLDIIDFAPKAFENFARACGGFHKGKTFSELDIYLRIPDTCK